MIIVNKNYFEFLYIIGRGGFGKVWKVKLKKTNEYFALKEMSKTKIIDRRSETSIMSERTLLSKLNNPFIVNMHFAFQDYSNLYLVMDLLSGGDLRYQLTKKKKFTEKETKFFISNIILALEYIHSKNIIHRDIKPENLVLELNGYLRITDFGVAKINEADNSSETSGTPGYMAPEVILVQNHSFPSDFFALGVIGYEFMLGYRPYLGRSRKEIRELIKCKQARLNEGDIPFSWSLDAADFINKLLKRKPIQRLGFNGIKELKSHIWMRDINWNALKRKELIAPFIPNSNRGNFDKKYCEKNEDVGRATLARYKEYKDSELFLDAFNGYTYIDLNFITTKLKKYKSSENMENKENDKKLNNMNNNINKEENKNPLLIQSPTSRMKKNNSLIFVDKKYLTLKDHQKLNNSNSQKILNFDKNILKSSRDTRNSKRNIINCDNKKENLKRMTANIDIKSVKDCINNINNKSRRKKEKNKKPKNDKENLRKRTLKISEKLKEMKKNQTNNDFNTNKNNQKKVLNKSNSMKMLNINIGVNMNYNLEKLKNQNESKKYSEISNIKTLNKKRIIINKELTSKKKVTKNINYKRIFSPKNNRSSSQKISTNKNFKSNSVILNIQHNLKKEETKKSEINKIIQNENNEDTNVKNIENKSNINGKSEIKNFTLENKILSSHNDYSTANDFNIKEFSKYNYNEPRSKVMFWIQMSHPINQYENKTNNINTIDKNENDTKINKLFNNNINNNQIKIIEEIDKCQRHTINSVNNQNQIINKKLDMNKKIGKNNINHNIYNITSNRNKNSKTINLISKSKNKNQINRKHKRTFGHSKRKLYHKNKSSSKSIYFDKSTSIGKSLKSKSPKNTFLVFNTININLGNDQKDSKRMETPKTKAIRNINTNLKEAYLKNDFIFGNMPFFAKM